MTDSINAQNAGYFSELAYLQPGALSDAPVAISSSQLNSIGNPSSLAGWTEITSFTGPGGQQQSISALFAQANLKLLSNGAYADQFRVFTNGSQIVFAIKGSTPDNWQNFPNDLLNSGFGDYQNLVSSFQEVFNALLIPA